MMHRYINIDQVYMLAAMQLQADHGNINLNTTLSKDLTTLLKDTKTRTKVKKLMHLYLNEDVLNRTSSEGSTIDGIVSKWLEFHGLDQFQAQTVFLGYVQQSPLYGSEMLEVGIRQKKEGKYINNKKCKTEEMKRASIAYI